MSTGDGSPPKPRSSVSGGGDIGVDYGSEDDSASPVAAPSTPPPLLALPPHLLSTRILPDALSASADALLVCKPLAALGREVLAEQEVRAQLVACRLRRLYPDAQTRALYRDDDRALALRRALLPDQQTPEERADALLAVQALLAGADKGVRALIKVAGEAGDGVAVRGLLRRRPRCLDERRLEVLVSSAIGGQHEAVAEAALESWLDAVGPAGGTRPKIGFLAKAAQCGVAGVVELLLAREGAAVNKPLEMQKALNAAVNSGRAAVVGPLLEAGAPADAPMLWRAAGAGSTQVVELLLARGGPAVTAQRSKDVALREAAKGRGMEVVPRRAGEANVDPEALPAAVDTGRVATARVLLQAGASPLHTLTCPSTNEQMVAVLVEAGVDITSQVGLDALLSGAKADRADAVRALLRAGAGARPGAAAAALERAAEHGSFKAVAALAGPAGRPEVAAQVLEAAVAKGRVEGARALAAAAGLSREQAEQAAQQAEAVWRARLRALAVKSWGQSVAAAVEPVAGRPRYSASA